MRTTGPGARDQTLCEEPGGGRAPWHQDQCDRPIDTDRTIATWTPLVDVPTEVGPVHVASRSHRLGDTPPGAPIGGVDDPELL